MKYSNKEYNRINELLGKNTNENLQHYKNITNWLKVNIIIIIYKKNQLKKRCYLFYFNCSL